MKALKYLLFLGALFTLFAGCQKTSYNDLSLVKTGAAPTNLAVLFTITQDNTGLVTVLPNGNGVSYYEVKYGDSTKTNGTVAPGKGISHKYAEGNYSVTIIAHGVTGLTTTLTKPLTVTFRAPENLAVTITQDPSNNFAASVSATAIYQTYFQVYFGDVANEIPTSFLQGDIVKHTYLKSGSYTIKVIALSGGAATTTYTQTITVAKQLDLPVTFDSSGIDYSVIDFGGNISVLTKDPTNNANHVMQTTKPAGAQTWAGTTICTALGFVNKIPITLTASQMSVRVYSPAAGIHVRLKIEDHNDATHSVETEAITSAANTWQTLIFDFANQAGGTAAYNSTYTYDKASIFFDFGNAGNGALYYFDDVKYLPVNVLFQLNLPVNFDVTGVDYTVTDFGGNSSVLAKDPTNSANNVMKSTKTSGAQTWGGTTIGTALGFASKIPISMTASQMSMRVYSPAAGIHIRLKIEDHNDGTHSIETEAISTLANGWETLVFDFMNPAAGTSAYNSSYTYDKASVFFDFGNPGTGAVFYWDDVKYLTTNVSAGQINLPVTFDATGVDYTMTDFGGNSTVMVKDPANAANNVMQSTKTMGAQTWGGTTIGTPLGFASPIPVSPSSSKMSMRVYSPAAGIHIRLKIEDHNDGTHSIETEALSTAANSWETLVFDFNNPAAGTSAYNSTYTYDKASVFFDFGNAGTGLIFYWDDVNKLP